MLIQKWISALHSLTAKWEVRDIKAVTEEEKTPPPECLHTAFWPKTGKCADCGVQVWTQLCQRCQKEYIPPFDPPLYICGWCFASDVY